MITFVIPQQAQVVSVNGKAEHIFEQDSQSLESGYEIAAGGKIEITSGAQVILKYADGSQVIIDEHFKATDNADTPDVAMDVLDEITEASDQPTPGQPQIGDDVLADIRAIQELILSDEESIDPVSTAAGSASDGGRSSAVSVERTGDETLAHAEFETETFTQAGQSKIFVDTSAAVTTVTTGITSVTLSADSSELTEANGGTITYTATLSNASVGITTVETTLGTITIADGATTGMLEHTVAADEDVYLDASTIENAITSASGGDFENLVVDNSPVITTVTDSLDVTSVTLSATAETSENAGTITYTATLSAVTSNNITVSTAQGDITINAYEEAADGTVIHDGLSGELTITLDGNDVYNDADISNAITGVVEANAGTDGSFESLVADSSPVTTTVTDSVDTTTATLSVDHSSINEDGALLTYTVTLDNAANNDVTVTTTQGEITIYAKGSVLNGVTQDGLSGSLVIMVNTDDSNNNIVITNSISDVSEAHAGETGSYEKLTADTGTVSTIVDTTPPIAIDDPTQTIIGLKGEYWGYQGSISNYQQLRNHIDDHEAEINFISTEVDYHYGTGNLADAINADGVPSHLITFLGGSDVGSDAGSIEGTSTTAASAGIIKLSGELNIIDGGIFSLNLRHDDGFVVIIDDKVYKFDGNTGPKQSHFNNIELSAGEHTVEVYYWDQGGAYVFEMELNDSDGDNVWVEDNLSHESSGAAIEVNEGNNVNIDILGNDSEQQDVTITIINKSDDVSITINPDGTVTYQAGVDFSGTDSFTYTITDAAGNVSNEATVTVNVNPVADQPGLTVRLGEVSATPVDMNHTYYSNRTNDENNADNIKLYDKQGWGISGTNDDNESVVFDGNKTDIDVLQADHSWIRVTFSGVEKWINISDSHGIDTFIFNDGTYTYNPGSHPNYKGEFIEEAPLDTINNYEIELNIDGAVTDIDGSELISYTIEGLPNGATLTVGTDNKDGSWTLTSDDAADVKIIVETDYPAFNVSVVANITDTAVIDGEIVTSELTSDPVVVPVSPLAIVNVDQTISVNDDMTPDTNVIIVLDISGSMKGDTFTEATSAIKALLATYDDKTNASIQIIGFEYKTIASVWFSGDDMLTEANKFIGKLSADGGTSYKDALEKVMSEFEKGITNGDVDPSDPTDVYFISDGAPSNGYGVTDDVEADWIAFTDTYNIDNVYTVGIDVSANEKQDVIDNLTPISLGNAPILLDDPAELTKILQDSLNANHTGNFLAGVSAALDAEVASVTINGTRYSFDGEKTITWDNPNNAPTSTTDISAAIETTYGIFEINFATGVYKFTPNDVDQDQTEIITIELRDAVGNTVDGQLNIEIKDVVSGNNANTNIVTDIDSNPYVLSELIADTKTQAGHNSANKYNAGDTDDYIYDSSHNGVKSKLNGGDGDDLLSGLGKNDTLNGEAGNDILLGGNDNDTLNGGADNDILIGGTGNDLLTGGSGIDTFVWLDGDEGTTDIPTIDHITDFNILEDKLDLSDLLEGVNSDELGDYLDLSFGSDSTTISIHAKGDSSSVSQVIILDNVDLSAAYPDVDFTSTAGINSILNDADDILI